MYATVYPLPAPLPPPDAAACEHRKDVARLMHGLARGLEGLLGSKPVPPGPRIVCVPAGVRDRTADIARIAPGLRLARTEPRDGSRRGEVVHLPLRREGLNRPAGPGDS